MRTVGRWATMLTALCATVVALFALNAWWRTAGLPYNTEGRYFDAEASGVYTDAEPQFWGVLACTALALGAGAAFLRWKLRRR
jgi:hypothetical protein